jgi:histidine triad (HIT) family protein
MTTDEQEAMQEKLKNMSPEELKEFQIKNCIFCQIISGKVQSKKVYDDEYCIAILDINPANPGHLLLLPKEHYSIMPLIPENILKHLFMISKQLSATLLRALKVEGTNIFVANGAVAGQKAQHFMIHIIPRKDNDNVGLNLTEKEISKDVLDQIREVLVEKVNQEFGIEGKSVLKHQEKEEQETHDNKNDKKNEENNEDQEQTTDINTNNEKDQPIDLDNLDLTPKTVEAEFSEDNQEEKKTKKKKTIKKKVKKKKKAKAKQKKEDSNENVSIDDIASLISGN